LVVSDCSIVSTIDTRLDELCIYVHVSYDDYYFYSHTTNINKLRVSDDNDVIVGYCTVQCTSYTVCTAARTSSDIKFFEMRSIRHCSRVIVVLCLLLSLSSLISVSCIDSSTLYGSSSSSSSSGANNWLSSVTGEFSLS